MTKIIILAGNGFLPINIINSLHGKKIDFFSLIISESGWDRKIEKFNFKVVSLGKILTEILKLKKLGFNSIVMAGNIKRPVISNIKPDIKSLKLLPRFAKVLLKGGDNLLLKFIISELEKLNFKVFDIKEICPELFLKSGLHSKKKLSKINVNDGKRGRLILSSLSKFDIGQSIIVQQGTVIGIEAIEGTDNLIKRSIKNIKDGEKPTLIKLFKKNQESRADLPTLGLNTVKLCKKYSIGGIIFSGNKTLFIDSEEIISEINNHKMFLLGLND